MATSMKNQHRPRPQIPETRHPSENSDPNLPTITTPVKKPIKSTPAKPTPSAKKPSAPQTPKKPVSPPPPPPRRAAERKFIVAKKKSRRGGKDVDAEQCRKAAYEALRASQEDFFRKDHAKPDPENEKDPVLADSSPPPEPVCRVPEPGSGRVKELVSAFETLLSVSRGKGERDEDLNKQMGTIQDLPVFKAIRAEVCSSAEFLTSWDSEKDSGRVCSSMDSRGDTDRLSLGRRTSSGSGRSSSRRNSTDSCGRSWNKKLKVTSQQPFKLRTEQRGRLKEEYFLNKVKEMLVEEEKKRLPIAQGLPWTTDEPEVLVKPPVKESTEPIDLVLHSDVRAVERADFDSYVTERLGFAEQMKLERERQQKLEEEEELRRLRMELVPKAQPMPYFDRPFIPKKSTRPRTIPKEPRFHIRPVKPSC